MALNIENIIAEIKEASILELNDLVKAIEEEFGVTAAAPVAVAAAGAADAGAAKDSFDVELTAAGDKKVGVIKVVREITGLGLKEAKELVDVVAEKMKAAASIVVVDSRGLTVEQDTVLRRNLRGSEVEFKVIKNSILRRAAEKAGLEDLASVFVGPSAVAFSNEDVIAPAKILNDFAKNADALEIKGGAIEGAVASKEEIVALATLPSREGLLSMLLSVLQAPVRNVALAVKAVADNKEDAA